MMRTRRINVSCKSGWLGAGFSWVLLTLAFGVGSLLQGQESTGPSPDYVRVTEERAEKIVNALALADPAQSQRTKSIVAKQYQDLHELHARRDEALKKGGASSSAGTLGGDAEAVRQSFSVKQYELHVAFLAKLNAELDPQAVEKIKDGMTYHVLPNTYKQYLELYPSLTDEQKRTIMSLLWEAREHAIDGGSSEEKHAWFGSTRDASTITFRQPATMRKRPSVSGKKDRRRSSVGWFASLFGSRIFNGYGVWLETCCGNNSEISGIATELALGNGRVWIGRELLSDGSRVSEDSR